VRRFTTRKFLNVLHFVLNFHLSHHNAAIATAAAIDSSKSRTMLSRLNHVHDDCFAKTAETG
jgi:hypothetical protein